MKLSKLIPLRAPTRFLQLVPASISFAVLLVVFLSLEGNVLAQNIQPRPVARLMSDPVNDVRYSRPRRVALAENRSAPTASAAEVSFESPTEIERRAFDQTNVIRVKNGLAPVVWDPQLCRMARVHSERMASLGFFDHATPEGSKLKDRAHENGILHFRVIAENIAYNKGHDDPGGFAVERWMISAGHRVNILYVGFQASAIGSYVSADGSYYLTQVFIAR
jgi:uncharacterized protein YkwD